MRENFRHLKLLKLSYLEILRLQNDLFSTLNGQNTKKKGDKYSTLHKMANNRYFQIK